MFLKVLLAFVPLAIGLHWADVNPLVVFVVSCLAIVPLANLMGGFTERLAEFMGTTQGGLLNATLGNAPELIITGFALSKGLTSVVKASISGSILMNLLLSLGLSMVAGGLHREKQNFNKALAGMSAALLTLASIGLIVPALLHVASEAEQREFSLQISVILFAIYLLSLVFTMGTHRLLFAQPIDAGDGHERPKSGLKKALVNLAATTAILAIVSETMTDSLGPAIKTMGLNEVFAGVVVLASLGNVAELITAWRFAHGDKMDLVLGITVGAATQAALAVAPLLVFTGRLMGQPMDLQFSLFEVLAVTLAVVVTGQFTRDGESTWIEGAMLVAVYMIFALGFYYSG